MWGLQQKQNARRADKIRLCGHLRRYKKIVKKTYIIYVKQLCIFVTHRLLNIGSSDKMIVLDKGKVIEQGVHKDLIKRDGKYK